MQAPRRRGGLPRERAGQPHPPPQPTSGKGAGKTDTSGGEVDALPAFLRAAPRSPRPLSRPLYGFAPHAPVLPLTRSVLTALTAGLMIGGGLLFVGGMTAGVLWYSGKGPVQTATIPMPPPQTALSPSLTIDPDPKPERPQVFTPPPAPPEPEPPAQTAARPVAPAAPAPAPAVPSGMPAPPSPLKPSDLDAKPPESILGLLLKPVPPAVPDPAPEPVVQARPQVPSVLNPSPSARPQVSAALPAPAPRAAPVAAPVTAPVPVSVTPPAVMPDSTARLPQAPSAQPPAAQPAAQAAPQIAAVKPEPVKPEPVKAAPVKAEPPKPAPTPAKAPPKAETAKPEAKPEAKTEAKAAPKPDSKTAKPTAPVAVQWQDGNSGPAVGSVATADKAAQPAPAQASAPVQGSVMDALTLPQAPVGSRVEVSADGERQTITQRTAAKAEEKVPEKAPEKAPEKVRDEKPSASGRVAVRSGVFAQDENVRSRLAELKAIGLSGTVHTFTNSAGKTMKVVEVGRYPSRKAAAPVIAKLKAKKLEVYVADPP